MFQWNFNFAVTEEHQLRVCEINDANSNYQRQVEILNEKMLILKEEEGKYSTLKLKDEELEHSITEEELKLKEVMHILQFLGVFAQLQRAIIGLVLSVSLSVSVHPSVLSVQPHGMTRLLQNRSSWNFILGSSIILCLGYSNLLKSDKSSRNLYEDVHTVKLC
jgi:hypothetical protein